MKTLLALLVLALAPVAAFAQSPIAFAHFVVLNTDASTPVQLTNSTIKVTKLTFIGRKTDRTDNTGTVWIGMTSTNDKQVIKVTTGATVSVNIPDSKGILLSSVYLDVENTSDGVLVMYE